MSINIVTENTLRDLISVRDTELKHANDRIEYLLLKVEKVNKLYNDLVNNLCNGLELEDNEKL